MWHRRRRGALFVILGACCGSGVEAWWRHGREALVDVTAGDALLLSTANDANLSGSTQRRFLTQRANGSLVGAGRKQVEPEQHQQQHQQQQQPSSFVFQNAGSITALEMDLPSRMHLEYLKLVGLLTCALFLLFATYVSWARSDSCSNSSRQDVSVLAAGASAHSPPGSADCGITSGLEAASGTTKGTATVRVYDLAVHDSPFASPRQELQSRAAAFLQRLEATSLGFWHSRASGEAALQDPGGSPRAEGAAEKDASEGLPIASAATPQQLALGTPVSTPRRGDADAESADGELAGARRRKRPSLAEWYSDEVAFVDSPAYQVTTRSPSQDNSRSAWKQKCIDSEPEGPETDVSRILKTASPLRRPTPSGVSSPTAK